MKIAPAVAALALATISGAASALTTYNFAYEGTQCPFDVVCNNSWDGTLTLTVPDGQGTFGNTFDGYTGVDVDPNIDVHISVDGNPLFLNRSFSVSLFGEQTLIYGVARNTEGIFIFNGMHLELGHINPDQSQTHGVAILTAVPEPGSLALMLAGFAAVGGVACRKGTRNG